MMCKTRAILLLWAALYVRPTWAQKKIALVIGIAGYPGFPAGERLKYAGRDAEDFAAFIQTQRGGGFLPVNVHLVTNAAATRDRLYTEFTWLRRTAGPNDTVYVFFAGHGVEFQSDLYFLPYNSSKEQPDANGIRMEEFFRRVTSDLSAKQVVVFVDACHAAGAEGGSRSEYTLDVMKQWDALNNKEGQFSMALFSSLAYQKSWEDEHLGGGHGLFTYYLLEGMKGAAPSTSKGYITADSLWSYVKERVEERSRVVFKEVQTPIASSQFRPDLPLAYVVGSGPTSSDSTTVPAPPPPVDQRIELIKQARVLASQIQNLHDQMNLDLRRLWSDKQSDIDFRVKNLPEGKAKEDLERYTASTYDNDEARIRNANAERYQVCCQQEALKVRNALILEVPGVSSYELDRYYSEVYQPGQPVEMDHNLADYTNIADDLEALANAYEKKLNITPNDANHGKPEPTNASAISATLKLNTLLYVGLNGSTADIVSDAPSFQGGDKANVPLGWTVDGPLGVPLFAGKQQGVNAGFVSMHQRYRGGDDRPVGFALQTPPVPDAVLIRLCQGNPPDSIANGETITNAKGHAGCKDDSPHIGWLIPPYYKQP